MPSDPRVEIALRALASSIEGYRSAVVTAVEEVRGYLASHQSKSRGGSSGVAASLGQFGAGHIDIERFSNLVQNGSTQDAGSFRKVEKAFDILRVIAAGEEDLFQVRVKSGARLRDVVAARMAEIGRAFAAARVAGLATAGRLDPSTDNGLLDPMSFERWNEAERRLAPPLVVEVEGADLHAGDLAEFLDGRVKVVLVVHGESAPAPLVRLITPTTFVLQTASENGLERFSSFEGPAVAALVPESAAQFVHDPARGKNAWQRVELVNVPEKPPKQRVGGMSVRQQKEELEQLLSLATGPGVGASTEVSAGAAGAPAAGSPVDKLAAWLLNQADLSNVD